MFILYCSADVNLSQSRIFKLKGMKQGLFKGKEQKFYC